jgi:3-hydroxypropanoate dehydrogenase
VSVVRHVPDALIRRTLRSVGSRDADKIRCSAECCARNKNAGVGVVLGMTVNHLEIATDTREHLHLDRPAQDLLFREARTPNAFTDDEVSDDQIRALYELVKWAPTTMNTQPLRIVLVRSVEGRDRLMSHLFEGNRAKAESAPLIAVLAADTSFHDTLPITFPHRPSARDAFADDARRIETARSQAWLQAGYFILGVRALGLAAGPMGGFDAAGLDADLFAGTPLRSILVMNIGRPAPGAWYDRLPRLDHDDVVTVI